MSRLAISAANLFLGASAEAAPLLEADGAVDESELVGLPATLGPVV